MTFSLHFFLAVPTLSRSYEGAGACVSERLRVLEILYGRSKHIS